MDNALLQIEGDKRAQSPPVPFVVLDRWKVEVQNEWYKSFEDILNEREGDERLLGSLLDDDE
jgi:hypothetical protein